VALDPEIRRLLPIDRAEVEAIDSEARSGLEGQRGAEAWLAEHRPLVALTDWPRTWVGTVDEVVVGFLCGTIDELEGRGRVFTVDRVYVRAQARDLGFGDALVAAALRDAEIEGCQFFEAVALPGDRETKNLYERAGITARSIVVSRRLG